MEHTNTMPVEKLSDFLKSYDFRKQISLKQEAQVFRLGQFTTALDSVTEKMLSIDDAKFSTKIKEHTDGRYFNTLKDILV